MMIQAKKEKIARLLKQNILVSPEFLEEVDEKGYAEITHSEAVLQKEEKQHTTPESAEKTTPQSVQSTTETKNNVKVLFSYNKKPKKRDVQDFIDYFNSRYDSLQAILRQRYELQNLTSINRIRGKTTGKVSIIGMVYEKHISKNGNLILTIEDRTGNIKVIVGKHKKQTFSEAKDTVYDEVLGIEGSVKGEVMFANNLVVPDVPIKPVMKKSPYEGYAVFLSDLHIGSNKFLSKEFNRFIKWISGETGTDQQREISSKVKYVFLAGDIVDGIGIYPNQQNELKVQDIYQQYRECADILSQIPENIKIIICPGNHDANRISEPQPQLSAKFAGPIIKLPNVISVSNPALVNIDASENFDGINVLLYHGYSFDYYVANVDSIRMSGGYDRADLIMKFLLKRRHLAPAHTSTLYIPDAEQDPLFIDTVPDIFATGHLHKTSASHYKAITLVSGSCWQAKTPFQEKLGHKPEPARVPVVNLHTRDIKILKFGD